MFEEMRNAFARTDPGWFHDERFGSLYSPWLFGQANDDSVRHGFKQGGPKKQVEFRIYPVSKGRSVLQTSKGQQNCASVPDFRRTNASLQLGGVRWTSPRRFTHRFDSLYLGGDANL